MSGSAPLISVSESAAQKIKSLLFDNNGAIGISIGVTTGGCSGLSYKFEYVYELNAKYEKVVSNGVTIFIEPSAVLHIIGTEMDYVGDKFSSKFIFQNPNAKSQCGCGKSFATG